MIIVGNLATVCFLQFGNDMLYTSLASSFCVAAIILLTLQVKKNCLCFVQVLELMFQTILIIFFVNL